jgi:hypothetical protein
MKSLTGDNKSFNVSEAKNSKVSLYNISSDVSKTAASSKTNPNERISFPKPLFSI